MSWLFRTLALNISLQRTGAHGCPAANKLRGHESDSVLAAHIARGRYGETILGVGFGS